MGKKAQPNPSESGPPIFKDKKSFVPRLLWLLLILVLVILFAYVYSRGWLPLNRQKNSPASPNSSANDEEFIFEQLYKTKLGFIEEKKNFVFVKNEELEKFWPEVVPLGGNHPLPKVDFSKEMVAAVALGDRSSSCNDLEINRVYKAGGKAIVEYSIISPEGDCPCVAMRTLLLEVIKFPKVAETVEFEEKIEKRDCKS